MRAGVLSLFALAMLAAGFLLGRATTPDPAPPQPAPTLAPGEPGAPFPRPLVRADVPDEPAIGVTEGDARTPAAESVPRLGNLPPIPEDVRRRQIRILRATWRELSGGEPMPDAALSEAMRYLEAAWDCFPAGAARNVWEREVRRRRFGELAEPVELVLGLATASRSEISMTWPTGSEPRCAVSSEPIDIEQRLPSEPVAYVHGGVIPEGHALIVESVTLAARWGDRAAHGRAKLKIDLVREDFELEAAGDRLEATWEGSLVLWPQDEDRVRLTGDQVAAEVRIRGRLIESTAFQPGPQTLRRTRLLGDGYMHGPPLRLQAAAGRDNVRVSLDPQRDRGLEQEGAYVAYDLFDAERDARRIEASHGRADGRGRLPPEARLEITEVRWEVRLDPDERRSSTVEIGVAKRRVLNADGRQGPYLRGSWSGSKILRGSQLDDVYVEVRNGAVADVVIEGRILEKGR